MKYHAPQACMIINTEITGITTTALSDIGVTPYSTVANTDATGVTGGHH